MKDQLENILKSIIKELYSLDKLILLTEPPSKDLGDFTTNIPLQISKEVGKNPREIGEEIKEKLSRGNHEEIIKIEIAGPGFLNIYINNLKFITSILSDIKNDIFFKVIDQNKKISLEHTAANPNKHLHIGHLRNFSIGDTLRRIFEKTGFEVNIQYFLNDQGLQVAKVIWGLKNLNLIGVDEYNQEKYQKYDTYAAEVYVASERFLSLNKIYEESVRDIIKNMETGDNEISDFAENIVKNILEGQLQTVSKFGVYYDEIITESTMTQSGEVEIIVNELEKTGKVEKETEGKNAGSIVIKGLKDENNKNIDDKILIRSDGTAVYTGKDIVLHLWKFGLLNVSFQFIPLLKQENNKELYISVPKKTSNSIELPQNANFHINVVDQRQSYPLEVVKQSLKSLGFVEESKNFHHLAYETVALSLDTAKSLGVEIIEDIQSVAMSGRKGIEIAIDDILEIMTGKILETSKKKGEGLLKDEAQKIAAGALRYYMIKYSYNTIIVFDINDALRADGDTGIYLMYSYVRAKNILEKSGVGGNYIIPNEIHPSIVDLITKISLTNNIIKTSVESLEVNKLTSYIYDLAKTFSIFYQEVNVSAEMNENKKNFYIDVVSSYEKVFKDLLSIIGLPAPLRM